jgi:hypothetical protein
MEGALAFQLEFSCVKCLQAADFNRFGSSARRGTVMTAYIAIHHLASIKMIEYS